VTAEQKNHAPRATFTVNSDLKKALEFENISAQRWGDGGKVGQQRWERQKAGDG
jgi:hypothetical protein